MLRAQKAAFMALAASLLQAIPYLTPIAERSVHKGESGDRGGVGAHHPRPQRNGVHEGLCKEQRALLGIEAALGADENGKRTRRKRSKRRKR